MCIVELDFAYCFISWPLMFYFLHLFFKNACQTRWVWKSFFSLFFLFADPAVNLVTSGPYGLIFASFVPFFFDIPISTRFRVFGVCFSDKSFIYLAGLQVRLTRIIHAKRRQFFYLFYFSSCLLYKPIKSNLFFQLLLSSWKRSILPGVCGILAGSLYRLNLFRIRRAKVAY